MKKIYELQIELKGEYFDLGEYETKKEMMEQLNVYEKHDRMEGWEDIKYYCTEKVDGEAVNFYQL